MAQVKLGSVQWGDLIQVGPVVLTTDVSGVLPVANGGTGSGSFTNGQILIGNTTGNTLTKATLTGTSNQVTVTNGAGSITLSLPQDIATSSNVTFGSVTAATVRGGTGSGGSLTLSSTSNATKGTVTVGSLTFDEANTRIGVGITPTTGLDLSTGANSAPATSGTSQTGNVIRVRSSGATVLDIGAYPTGGYMWMQGTSSADLSLTRDIYLQPNGGAVQLGSGSAGQLKFINPGSAASPSLLAPDATTGMYFTSGQILFATSSTAMAQFNSTGCGAAGFGITNVTNTLSGGIALGVTGRFAWKQQAAGQTIGTAISTTGDGIVCVGTGAQGSVAGMLQCARLGLGVTSTATAAGTTTLTTTSNIIQIFTGSTTQSVTLPAANANGSGIAVVFIIKNRSSGTVTINRAGSDTIDGGTSTTLTGGSNSSVTLASDGSSAWVIV